ncbi:serine/threonine protein kinase [Streptomyces triticagri]|uniref:Serine/threonine protein kinase n=2 Tax=Streptomyces triticagri TaxID=2293568 RepID=A0A372M3Q8_9ACTN|nr:serine/threonine protein kinase [Streptomyces triticagri]
MGEVFLARGQAVADPADRPTLGLGAGGSTAASAGHAGLVAVKVVRRDLAREAGFRARFRREIKVAGAVRGPYAAAVADADPDAETPWLATAFVAGPTLAAAVRGDGPLPEPAVRGLGARLALALDDLHGSGVLHRDLKPGNVLLDLDGPRLIDFGIARATGATTMTATGLLLGTPGFMSPEHLAGGRAVTGASDVFCLGSLLCYAASGEDPFGDGPVPAVLHRVAEARTDLSAVPEALRPVLADCLRVDPAERPTPSEVAERLGGDEELAWPDGVRERVVTIRREADQLVAAGTALLAEPEPGPGPGPESVPTPGPARPAGPPTVGASAAPPLHHLPTMGPAPAAPPGPPRAGGRRARTVIAVCLAAALVGGGAGLGLHWWQSRDDVTGPGRGADARPGAEGTAKVLGVDDRGRANGAGEVPQDEKQRPAGWKPWRGDLSGPSVGCSAGPTVLACRTNEGRVDVLDTASGKRLWQADLVKDDRDRKTFIGPSGAVFIPGGTTQPTVHGDLVAFVSDGTLQVRDARSGAVRWQKKASGAADTATRPLVGDGAVFVTTSSIENPAVTAFALKDGTERWSRRLTNRSLSRAETRNFEPVTLAGGIVYAVSDAGIVGYDAESGEQSGQVESGAKTCGELMVHGRSAYCAPYDPTGKAGLDLHRMDARTLASTGRPKIPSKVAKSGAYPTAVGEHALVAFDPGAAPYADWGDDDGPATLSVLDPRTGAELGQRPLPPPGDDTSLQALSNPLIAGGSVVYADHSALYTVPLGKDGTPGKVRRIPVKGAPGPRAKDGYDRTGGYEFAKEVRPPQVLPIGGVAHLVYDTGDVVSVELPAAD